MPSPVGHPHAARVRQGCDSDLATSLDDGRPRHLRGDLAARLCLANVFAEHEDRYPHVTIAEITEQEPDFVLLPDEPYRFTAEDGPGAFPGLPCALVQGRDMTW